jgi:hypothetical protein
VYGTDTDQNIQSSTFSNNYFSTLFRGIRLGSDVPVNGGPSGVRLVQNSFDEISQEGIIIKNVSLNATAYNVFYDVGNQFFGVNNPVSSIIDIDADNNISVGDSFLRNNTQSTLPAGRPRIALNRRSSIALGTNVKEVVYYQDNVETNTAANSIDLGTYQQLAGISDNIPAESSGILVKINNGSSKINAFKINYTIFRDTKYRTGTLTVASGSGFSYLDEFVENDDVGITLTAADASNQVTVSYQATAGQAAIINYSISTLG